MHPVTEGLAVKQQVEARYRGKNRWFTGIIAKVHTDGTYDVVMCCKGNSNSKQSLPIMSFTHPLIHSLLPLSCSCSRSHSYSLSHTQEYDDGEVDSHMARDLIRVLAHKSVSNYNSDEVRWRTLPSFLLLFASSLLFIFTSHCTRSPPHPFHSCA